MAPDVVRSQGHETPTHHPDTPRHKPSVHKPAKPQHPKHTPASRSHPARPHKGRDGGKKDRKGRSHKSAPAQERTLPIGGGAWVPVESLGTLPIYRRH